MAWLIGFLEMLAKLVIPILIKETFDIWKDGKEASDWKKAEKAKLDEAVKNYKEDLKKAGNDEQAQKDAYDKLLNSSR